jgi:hypothetical protein
LTGEGNIGKDKLHMAVSGKISGNLHDQKSERLGKAVSIFLGPFPWEAAQLEEVLTVPGVEIPGKAEVLRA